MADPQEGRGVDDIGRQSSQLFVRNSTGLVREASALRCDGLQRRHLGAPSVPRSPTSIFFTLAAFPGADVIAGVPEAPSVVLNIPILIMFALMASSHAPGGRRLRLGQPDPAPRPGP